MTVLLSIKPEYANKIFAGTKKFEYRKTIFKRKDVKKVIVYASHPIQKVLGEFEIDDILMDSVELIWKQTNEYSGITKQFFDEYFENKLQAHAIKVGKVIKYNTPKFLSDYDIKVAPQSFVYLENQEELSIYY
jgi:predicted transcriptional regulator